MRISVVIPTYNSAAVIGRALGAVLSGHRQPDELIVVDGISDDDTAAIAKAYTGQILPNPKRHAAAARNLGIKAATGNVIAFTDSDCVPNPEWLSRIADHFTADPNLAGLGGRMLALPPKNDIEAFSGHVFLNEILCYPDKPREIINRTLAGAFITANCAYKRSCLEEINGFRDEFGNNAEDIDLYWRMVGCQRLYYDPQLVVYHSFPDSRRALMRKYFQHGFASSKLTRYHLGGPRVDWQIYRKLLTNLGKLILPADRRGWASLYCLQLGAHLAGKAYGSILMGVVNL